MREKIRKGHYGGNAHSPISAETRVELRVMAPRLLAPRHPDFNASSWLGTEPIQLSAAGTDTNRIQER
jgi:hypothetical protein